MPSSLWIFLIVSIASFFVLIDDHGETWEELKESTGAKKRRKGIKLFAMWFVCVFSLIGTLALAYESLQDAKKEADQEKQYNEVTNQLAQAHAQLQQTRAQLTDALTQSQSAEDDARVASQQENPRTLTDFQKKYGKDMLSPLAGTPVAILAVMDDSESYNFQQILNTFLNDDAGWKSTDGGRAMLTIEQKGILISCHDAADTSKCLKLAKFLHSCGFIVHITPPPSGIMPQGAGTSIVIVVGPK
jgi:hypothetical protein